MKARSLLLLGFFLATGCSDSTGPNGNGNGDGNGGPDPIASGSWSAQADFGTFAFTVNSGGTAITQIALTFQSFSCGGVTVSGTMTVTASWSITNREFSITVNANPDPLGSDRDITVTGSFADSGQQVSGSFTTDWGGQNCPGTWSGSAG